MATTLPNNGSFNPSTPATIKLRANSGGTPMSHDDVDANFENLRVAHNEVVSDLANKAALTHVHADVTVTESGMMLSADKVKLDNIAPNANNYILPSATDTVTGGVKVGANLDITSGVLSVPLGTTSQPGVVEYDNNTIKKNVSGQLYVDGSNISDNDTTYTATSGLQLNGTVFGHADTSTQVGLNGATTNNRTFIQSVSVDGFGHVTDLTLGTCPETTYSHHSTPAAWSGIGQNIAAMSGSFVQSLNVDQYGHVYGLFSNFTNYLKIAGTGGTSNGSVPHIRLEDNVRSTNYDTSVTANGATGIIEWLDKDFAVNAIVGVEASTNPEFVIRTRGRMGINFKTNVGSATGQTGGAGGIGDDNALRHNGNPIMVTDNGTTGNLYYNSGGFTSGMSNGTYAYQTQRYHNTIDLRGVYRSSQTSTYFLNGGYIALSNLPYLPWVSTGNAVGMDITYNGIAYTGSDANNRPSTAPIGMDSGDSSAGYGPGRQMFMCYITNNMLYIQNPSDARDIQNFRYLYFQIQYKRA